MRLTAFPRYLARLPHRPRDLFKALLVLIVAGPVIVGGTAMAAFLFVPLPAVVPDPIPGATAETSHVYACPRGAPCGPDNPEKFLIATFHAEHNRQLIKIGAMPEHLQKAAIAAEDARFYEHKGFDPKAVTRALIADLRAGATVQGGSTITQQYVKNTYIERPKRTIFRKVREVLIAFQVEKTKSKSKILEGYLNTVYFGKGAYGIEAAARTYFNKGASELTLSESAQLVGLIPAPVRYSPYDDPEEAESRRIFVISRMEELGMIDAATAQQARDERPQVAPPKEEVFRYPWFVDGLTKSLQRSKEIGSQKLYAGGLRIYASVDTVAQEAAEKIVAETLEREDDPHGVIVAVEPGTGFVRAIVGGREYDARLKFNLATQGNARPGSAFKTFTLIAALEEGMQPSRSFRAPGVLQIKGWGNDCSCVHNFGSRGYGRLSIEKATVNSVNTVYAQMVQNVGAEKVVDAAVRMGIKAETLKGDEKNAAIALGGLTRGVSPLEMASAYATLGANGTRHEPRFFTRIEDSTGDVVLEGPSEPVQALEPNIAANANQILTKVITSGTGKRADIDRPAAGKTGTDQDFNNASFVGYTPDLSAMAWLGYLEANKPLARVNGVRNVTGGTIPAQMWAEFMKAALSHIPPTTFEEAGKISRTSDDAFRLPFKPRPTPSPSPEPSPEPPPESPEPSPSPSPSPSPTFQPSPLPTATSTLPGPDE